MTVSQKQKRVVRQRAKYHCEYCKRSEKIIATNFEVDHIIPISKSGTDDIDNLCCACRDCNARKSNYINYQDPLTNEETLLFNPRSQVWSENFEWSKDGSTVIGLTATGRATIICLDLNNKRVCTARVLWHKLGWIPPLD